MNYLNCGGRASAAPRSKLRRQARRLPGAILLALITVLAVQAWSWGQAPAAAPQGELLEDLKFQVEYLLWKDVAQAQLTLKAWGPGTIRRKFPGSPWAC